MLLLCSTLISSSSTSNSSSISSSINCGMHPRQGAVLHSSSLMQLQQHTSTTTTAVMCLAAVCRVH
jgi:hypothetical protein